MLIEEVREITEEAGLHCVDPVGIAEVLESLSQPLSSEELYDLAQHLTEQQKENEEWGGLWNQRNAVEGPYRYSFHYGYGSCDWEHSCTVKTGIRAMLLPYYEILQGKRK
jgi:hypothetical protein